jgi:hypothetical protein
LAAAPQQLHPSKAFTRFTPLLLPPPALPLIAAAIAALPTHRPLRFDPTTLIYTDGSKIDLHLGAGIYFASSDTLVAVALSGHAGQLNTVPKAEGTAILAALQHANQIDDITILTDSLTCIHMIRNMLTAPTRYGVHKHKHMLKKS